MANTNAPFGFKMLGNSGGASPNFEHRVFKVASNNTTAIYYQDPVKLLNTGYIAQWTAGTAVSQLAGIFVGCKYYNTAVGRVVNSPYWPGANASGDVEAYVMPCLFSAGAPQFVVQGSGTAFTLADVGQNIDVAIGTGSALGGCFSGATVDYATLATTATLPFRIMRLWSDIAASGSPGTEASSYNWVVVAANNTGSTGI